MRILKKGFLFFLALSMILSSLSFAYADTSEDTIIQTIRTLGIMTGDGQGNLNLNANVTRAQFAKMAVAASSFKDTVGENGTGYSLYKDVKSNHWASEYIQVCVAQKWVVGYTDGTFRPNNNVTLEEACTVVLHMLGYDSSKLAGSYPSAQLSKASALGLRKQINAVQGQALTRKECAALFYNLLTASTSNGQTYAQTLGYSLNNGTVDYTSVAKGNLEGPFVAAAGQSLPFTPRYVYFNGNAAQTTLKENDVYYYSQDLSSLWIYNNKVTGKITALNPSSASPTSVSIGGKSYSIGSSSAAYSLSVFAGTAENQYITLLLGMDSNVVGILSNEDVDAQYFGVVQSVSKNTDTENDSAEILTTMQLLCTDGSTRSFTVDSSSGVKEGSLASAYITAKGVKITLVSEKKLSGKVSSRADSLDDYNFAKDIEILDTNEYGSALTVEPERLAGVLLSSSDVRYYSLDADGRIDCLILDNVTGDLYTYGYLTAASVSSMGMDISASYTYLVSGKSQRISGSTAYSVKEENGIAIASKADGSTAAMKQLSSAKLTNLGTNSVQAGKTRYDLDENVQVYLIKDGVFYETTAAALDPAEYEITGWYDDLGCAAGGQIRIITAEKKLSSGVLE